MKKTVTLTSAKPVICKLWTKRTKLKREEGKKEEKKERENKIETEKGRQPRKGEKKIAASGLSRCSWNNFDVCMDEGALPSSRSTPSFLEPFLVPGSFFRGVNSAYHMAAVTVVP